MTANQYRAALAKLGLPQVGAARLFGVNDVTSRRWAKSGVSGTVAILLRLLVAKKITVEDIEAVNGR
jgi:hypothetical protein